ncbi:MAG: Sec-independent protein translocase protein TatB, partial [Pollutimonas bauzanensis]
MFDVSFSELLLIGVIALIVIGPERLPKVARTLGHLIGRAQRYVSDVKTDIQREMDLDELTDLKGQMEDAAKSVKSSMQDASASLRKPLDEAQQALKDASASVDTLVKDTKAQASLDASGGGSASGNGIGGGEGEVPAWSTPVLLANGEDGIASVTPADQVWVSGTQ